VKLQSFGEASNVRSGTDPAPIGVRWVNLKGSKYTVVELRAALQNK